MSVIFLTKNGIVRRVQAPHILKALKSHGWKEVPGQSKSAAAEIMKKAEPKNVVTEPLKETKAQMKARKKAEAKAEKEAALARQAEELVAEEAAAALQAEKDAENEDLLPVDDGDLDEDLDTDIDEDDNDE